MKTRCAFLRPSYLLLLAVLLPVTSSCDDPLSPVICTDEYVFGLHIYISDAETGEAIGEEASILVSDGSYHETPVAIAYQDAVVAYAAGERAGDYDISVALNGYETWTAAGVDVDANRCHVIPVKVQARLVRER